MLLLSLETDCGMDDDESLHPETAVLRTRDAIAEDVAGRLEGLDGLNPV